MKRHFILHPFLLAAYPIVSLLAFNLDQVTPREASRALMVVIPSAIILLLVLKLLIKDWHRAGFLLSTYLMLFFSFGHVVRAVENITPTDWGITVADLSRYFASLWAVIFILGTWSVWRLLKRDARRGTEFLNLLAVAALIVPTINVITHTVRNIGVDTSLPLYNQEKIDFPPHQEEDLPDIYYIIMDAYGREDILEDIYSHDNSGFIDFLTSKGFYVASESRSNYSQTLLSLSSSMNMQHIHYLTERLENDYSDRQPITNLVQNNKVINLLSNLGYKSVAISSGWTPTSLKEADIYFSSDASYLNDLEGLLILNTLPGTLYRTNFLYELQRRRILYIFEALKEIPAIRGPKFVFAHVISPHPPFVFGPNGEKIDTAKYYSLNEDVSFVVNRELANSRYRDQLTYMNKVLEETINQILATSEKPPIILLQADHGPGGLPTEDKACFKKRMSILNAFYFPTHGSDFLYDSITPVNSFRVLFDLYFRSDLGLLEDKSYYSLSETPYDFLDLTGKIENKCVINDSATLIINNTFIFNFSR
jgi:hypothetical protein